MLGNNLQDTLLGEKKKKARCRRCVYTATLCVK